MTRRIGIDLGGTKIEAIALDGSAEAARIRLPTPPDYAGTIETVATLVSTIEGRAGRAATIGVGIPGAIVPSTGLVKNANSVWLIGRPLAADLEDRLGRPVRVANDANCLAVSEAADGAGTGADVVFAAILGTGVGAGIVVRGQVLTGPNALAGEWGHNPLPWPAPDEWPGRPCYCGRTGCIETFLSGPALALEYERLAGRSDTPPAIVRLAEEGDPHAATVLDRYEDRTARALAGVINLLDPDVIVLGGGLSNVERLYRRVPALLRGRVFGATAVAGSAPSGGDDLRTRLVRAAHGDSSGVRGAAWLWPG
jgi:fructokinase